MQYMMLIYSDETAEAGMTEEEQAAMMQRYTDFTRDVRERGAFVYGEPLQPTAMATTVRLHNGRVMPQDGPYAETKEQLGGFYILECADLDEAIALAAKIPAAEHGAVEIRPVMAFGG